MKKRSDATQTLRAGCSKADPQTEQTHRQGRLQYTAQLSTQCKYMFSYGTKPRFRDDLQCAAEDVKPYSPTRVWNVMEYISCGIVHKA